MILYAAKSLDCSRKFAGKYVNFQAVWECDREWHCFQMDKQAIPVSILNEMYIHSTKPDLFHVATNLCNKIEENMAISIVHWRRNYLFMDVKMNPIQLEWNVHKNSFLHWILPPSRQRFEKIGHFSAFNLTQATTKKKKKRMKHTVNFKLYTLF